MKIIFALALVVAGINAWPRSQDDSILKNIDFNNERLITDAIASAVQDASQAIKDAGLDPLNIDSYAAGYALPVPVIFNINAEVENVRSNGLSNIVISDLNMGLLTYRLTFTFVLPRIEAGLGSGNLGLEFFGYKFGVSGGGSLAIVEPRVVGDMRFSVGIFTGISLRSCEMGFTLGGVQSNVNLVVQNTDASNFVNNFVGDTIPRTLNEFRSEIDELLTIVVRDVIEANL